MTINKHLNGSQWNKWDLHIHTPESILNNNFGTDWDKYVERLFKQAIKENVVAIGITDYYSIDGYKKIRTSYLNDESKLKEIFTEDEISSIKNMFIFPNIEFRINKLIVGKEKDLKFDNKVNFHVIFSDKVAPEDIEENFLHLLKFESVGVSNGTIQSTALTPRNLLELGKRLKKEEPSFGDHSHKYIGVLNASIDDSDIVNVLSSNNKIFKNKYLLATPTDEDLSKVSWSSQGHLARKILYQKSDFIFSSNNGTKQFVLGEKHPKPSLENFIKEFGNPKPCLWGSDAHSYDKLFKPDENRYTWIKSNPTFDGLKQVIFEPEDRVKIQLNKPEVKTPYQVIKKVRFIDTSGNNTFQKEWINFNPNLNTIIGGKSSGKSLLLYHIAKAIDFEQVESKSRLIYGSNYDDLLNNDSFDFEVIWESGDENSLSSQSNHESQITYIPQLYINHLAEEDGEGQLKHLIDSILSQSSNYKDFIEQKQLQIQDYKSKLLNSIGLRISLTSTYKELISKRKEIGALETVKNEIKRLTKKTEDLNKDSGFNKNELKKYKKLSEKITKTNKSKYNYENSITTLNKYQNFINRSYDNFTKESIAFLNSSNKKQLSFPLIEKMHNSIFSNLEINKSDLEKEILNISEKITTKITETKDTLNSVKIEIAPFKEKIKNQELLKDLEKQLYSENEKIKQIQKYTNEINKVVSDGKKTRKDIISYYTGIFDCYKDIQTELTKPEFNKIDQEITLKSKLNFDCEKFEQFTNLFDNRARLNSNFPQRFDDENKYIYNENTHIESIIDIFDTLKSDKKNNLKLKSIIDPDDLLYKLLDNYFKIDYEINYKNDNFIQMSPGKRGLVLLQIILHISNASHPILIDQPEDNLDNRTIYDDLKQFIRDKKKTRQIIIVSHNANLVVSTDSENIIVANQSGQQLNKDNKKYTFEYINGAIENSFLDESIKGILYQSGIKEHVCDILEGGKDAFLKRERKYGFI